MREIDLLLSPDGRVAVLAGSREIVDEIWRHLTSGSLANVIQVLVLGILSYGSLAVYGELRDRSSTRGAALLDRSRKNALTRWADIERRAIERWGDSFEQAIGVRGKNYLGHKAWIVDKPESFISVDPSGGTADFPIVWAEDSGFVPDVRFENSPVSGFISKITRGRHANWSDFVVSVEPKTFDGHTVAVARINGAPTHGANHGDSSGAVDGFASEGFLEIRPSSYFPYLDTSAVLSALDAYTAIQFRSSRWAKFVPWSLPKQIERSIKHVDPVDFDARSASVGLSVALLISIEDGEGSEDDQPTHRLLLHAKSAQAATNPGRVDVAPAGELSVSTPVALYRSAKQDSVSRFVYTSFVKELAEELFQKPGSSEDATDVPWEGLMTSEVVKVVGIAIERKVKLCLVGFMLDSQTLKGELLGISVVSEGDIEQMADVLDTNPIGSTFEGEFVDWIDDGQVGIPVRKGPPCGGIPDGVFELPLAPAAAVLLDRVDAWLRSQ